MPVDSRRIVGPDGAVSLLKFIAQHQQHDDREKEKSQLVDDSGKRVDGRKTDELRPFFLKSRVVSQANGSAFIEMGNTKVICAVYGPREIAKRLDFSTNGQIFCEFKYAPFSCPHRQQYQQSNEERELSKVLKEALEPAVCLVDSHRAVAVHELHFRGCKLEIICWPARLLANLDYKFPKAQVDVFVTVLDNGGSAFAAAITAAGAALANAGIPMFDVIIGCSLHCHGSRLLLDPTDVEENAEVESSAADNSTSSCSGNITLALLPSLEQISCLLQHGVLEKHTIVQAVKLLTDSCHNLHPAIQQNLIKGWKQESKERNLKLNDDATD